VHTQSTSAPCGRWLQFERRADCDYSSSINISYININTIIISISNISKEHQQHQHLHHQHHNNGRTRE